MGWTGSANGWQTLSPGLLRWGLPPRGQQYLGTIVSSDYPPGTGTATGTSTATAAGLSRSIGTETSAGTSSVAAAGVARSFGTSSSAGTSTVAGAGTSQYPGTATSAGTSTVAAAGISQSVGGVSSAGTSTATGAGTDRSTGTATAAGTSTASATPLSIFNATGTSAGTAGVVAAGIARSIDTATAAGTSSATANGAALEGSGTAVGTSTAASAGYSIVFGAATVAGASMVAGAGVGRSTSTVTSTGTSTAAAVGASTSPGTAVSASTAAESAVGFSRSFGVAPTAGTSTASALGLTGSGTSTGTSTALAVGSAVVVGTGTAAGTCTVSGTGYSNGASVPTFSLVSTATSSTDGGGVFVLGGSNLGMSNCSDAFTGSTLGALWTNVSAGGGTATPTPAVPAVALWTGSTGGAIAGLRTTGTASVFDAHADFVPLTVAPLLGTSVLVGAITTVVVATPSLETDIRLELRQSTEAYFHMLARENGLVTVDQIVPFSTNLTGTVVQLRILRYSNRVLLFGAGRLLADFRWLLAASSIGLEVANDATGGEVLTQVRDYERVPVVVFGGEPAQVLTFVSDARVSGVVPAQSLPGSYGITGFFCASSAASGTVVYQLPEDLLSFDNGTGPKLYVRN